VKIFKNGCKQTSEKLISATPNLYFLTLVHLDCSVHFCRKLIDLLEKTGGM